MAERAAAVPNRGALSALRTAMIIVAAAGVNDILLGAVPRYEPLGVYLVAVALVTLLDGIVIGAVATAAAVAFYALLHLRDVSALVAPAMLPRVGALVAVVVVAGVARAIFRSRRRRRPQSDVVRPQPPLLDAPRVELDQTEVLSAIDDLREELRAAVAGISAPRQTTEDSDSRAPSDAAVRDELRAAELALAESRGEVRSLTGRVAELQGAISEADAAARAATLDAQRAVAKESAHAARLASDLAAERQRLSRLQTDAEARSSEAARFAREAEDLRVALDRSAEEAETARLDAATRAREVETLREELDGVRNAVAAERDRQNTLRGGMASRARELESAVADLQRVRHELETTRNELEETRTELVKTRTELEETRTNLEETRGELETSRSAMHEARSELNDGRADAEAATADLYNTRAELERSRAEIERLSGALAAERARADAEADTARQERTLRERLELDMRTGDNERDRLRTRIGELEESLAHEVSTIADLDRDLDTERTRADAATAEVETERARTEAVLLERDRLSAEFDAKLQTIVTHLAQDHEADLGKALEEKEEARAEARSAMMRLGALQKKIDDEARLVSEVRSAAQTEIDRLRARIAQLETNAVVPPPSPPAVAARRRILVAHPDADMRMNARASLERAGYEIVSAADGLEALRTAIAHHPDVVIADAVMPKMDGRELCQLLKSQEKTANIRVILLMRPSDDPPKGELVPDQVLLKPVPLETLKATLAALIAS